LVRTTGIPVDLVHLLEGHVAGDAGVVDEHVDRAELLLDLRHRARAGIEVGHVAGHGGDGVAVGRHLCQPFGVGLVAGRERHRHLVAGVDHLGRDRLAEDRPCRL
jgi:hypothetical protein